MTSETYQFDNVSNRHQLIYLPCLYNYTSIKLIQCPILGSISYTRENVRSKNIVFSENYKTFLFDKTEKKTCVFKI